MKWYLQKSSNNNYYTIVNLIVIWQFHLMQVIGGGDIPGWMRT